MKNLTRIVIVLGLLTWPVVTLQTYRLWQTNQQMREALALERSVTAKLEVARAHQAQVAKAESAKR